MSDTITLRYNSLTHLFEDWTEADSWRPLKEFFRDLRAEAKGFGLELTDFEPDESNDIFWVTVAYGDVNDVRKWMKSCSPELEDEEINELIQEAAA